MSISNNTIHSNKVISEFFMCYKSDPTSRKNGTCKHFNALVNDYPKMRYVFVREDVHLDLMYYTSFSLTKTYLIVRF